MPDSPLNFNIFSNDMLDGCGEFGVEVPGLPPGATICGLLFADDLVLLAPTRRKLRDSIGAILAWATKNMMTLGVGKCGIMGCGEGAMAKVRASPNYWRVGEESIPIVEEYKYLGVIITCDMDLKRAVQERVDKG